MWVESVAMASAKVAMPMTSRDSNFAAMSVGFHSGLPKRIIVAPVTATPMKAKSTIVPGSPMAWPTTWSRCDFA